jgi:hypothetical protein
LAPERLAVQEAAHSMTILEAIDRDLDARGLLDKRERRAKKPSRGSQLAEKSGSNIGHRIRRCA